MRYRPQRCCVMRIMRVIKRRNKIVFWSLFYKNEKCDVFWVEGFFFIRRLWNHMTDSRVVRVYRGSQSWINMIIINHTVLWCNIEYNSYITPFVMFLFTTLIFRNEAAIIHVNSSFSPLQWISWPNTSLISTLPFPMEFNIWPKRKKKISKRNIKMLLTDSKSKIKINQLNLKYRMSPIWTKLKIWMSKVFILQMYK